MPNNEDVMLIKIEIDPQSLDAASAKLKSSVEKASRTNPKSVKASGGDVTFSSQEEGRAKANTMLSGNQEIKLKNQVAKAVIGGFDTVTAEEARGGVSFSGTTRTDKSYSLGKSGIITPEEAKKGLYGSLNSVTSSAVKGVVSATIGALNTVSPEAAKAMKYTTMNASLAAAWNTHPDALPAIEKRKAMAVYKGMKNALSSDKGGPFSALGDARMAYASVFGGASAVVGMFSYALKRTVDIINWTGGSLKEFNASIFATSTRLDYFWMSFKYRIGKYLEKDLPVLMEKAALVMSEWVETGAMLLNRLSPLVGKALTSTAYAAKGVGVGLSMSILGGASDYVKNRETVDNKPSWLNEMWGFKPLVQNIAENVSDIKLNTMVKEGATIATSFFGAINSWSHNKGKDFGEMGVGGFRKTPNASNILKDMVGLKPQEDFFLNGAGADKKARFPGPAKTENHFKAADTIKIEFSDYDRIMFSIQNAINEMLVKTSRSNDMRFSLLNANLARITR